MLESIWKYVYYILKGENKLFHIRIRKKNIFALFADFEAYEKMTILCKWRKNPKFWNFFFLCRIVTGQNFESYTALERRERLVWRSIKWYKCGQNMENRPNLALLKVVDGKNNSPVKDTLACKYKFGDL